MIRLGGVLLLLVCLESSGWASTTLFSDTQVGTSSFEETLGANGDTSRGPRRKLNWSASFDYIQTQNTDPLSGLSITDKTSQFLGELGFERLHIFELGAGLELASTPDENLKDFGLEFWLQYTLNLGENSQKARTATGDDEFFPHLSFKLEFTPLTYTQTFTNSVTSRTGRAKPVTGTNVIKQLATLFEVDVALLSDFSAKLGYTNYSYDRDVNSFLQNLDSPRGVALGASAFAGTVGGFSSYMESLDLTWTPLDDWEFDGDITGSAAAIDSSWTWTYKGGFMYNVLKDLRAGLAFEYEAAPTLIDHIYTASLKYDL